MKIIVQKNISIGELSKELAEELSEIYGCIVTEHIIQFAVAEIERIKIEKSRGKK